MDNSQRLNELFNQARNQEPKTSFDDTKAAFKSSLEKGGGPSKTVANKIVSLKNLLIRFNCCSSMCQKYES